MRRSEHHKPNIRHTSQPPVGQWEETTKGVWQAAGGSLGRMGGAAANAIEHGALEEVIGRSSHDREGDEFGHEGCGAQQARQPSFDTGFEIGHHDHGNERPSGISPDQDDCAEGKAPTDLLGGEYGIVRGFDGDLLTVVGGRYVEAICRYALSEDLGFPEANRGVPSPNLAA